MNLYELAYLIRDDIPEEEVKEIENNILGFLRDEEGFVINQNSLLRKKLAYPIKKQIRAYLADITFKLPPGKILSLDKKIKSDNRILRHLLITKKEMGMMPEKKRRMPLFRKTGVPSLATETAKEKKIDLKDIDQKLEEILEQKEI